MVQQRGPAVRDDVVLVTGATSGIGAGLASRFHARGARVLAAGRDPDKLEAFATRHPGMDVVVMDVSDQDSIGAAMAEVATRTPHLTTVINNAGVQLQLDFSGPRQPSPTDIATEIATNLTGLVTVTSLALPLLGRAPRSRVVQVGSGLGYVPLTRAPVYSATKAAVHSFSLSLRHQLRDSTIQVVELIPPAVDTPLHRGMGSPPPMSMGLDTFLRRTMRGLDAGHDEIAVGLGRVSRIGARLAPATLLRLINQGT